MVDPVPPAQQTDPNSEAAREAAANAAASGRPEGLPEKFSTMEAYNASYLALEQRLSGTAPSATPTAPAAGAPQANPLAITPSAAAFDLTPFETEFANTGALGEASYTKLAAAGYPKETVDRHIQGQIAIGQQQSAQVYAAAGGESEYAKIQEWAGRTMTEEQMATFNAMVTGVDTATATQAIKGLAAQYKAAEGTQPSLLSGDIPGSVVNGYESQGQMTEAISDPRYQTDSAYRNEVAKKIEAMGAIR